MSSSAGSFEIQDTFGAMLIGTFVTMILYGITTLQAYFYYLSFPKDGKQTKLLVLLIWLLDTFHSIFVGHCVHRFLIAGFVDRSLLVNGNWSLFLSIGTNVLEAFIVQAFFAHRIFILCSPEKRWWVAGVIGFFVVAHFAFGLKTVVYLFITKEFARLQELSASSIVPFGITTIISDILIAVALCILLHSNRSEFGDTNTIINKLILYAINRCILTTAVAFAETIVFSVLPNSFYSIAIDFIVGKLYANSLLAVLNSRANLRPQSRAGFSDESTEMSTRFNVTSGVANHQTSLFQVRTRESARETVPEKRNQELSIMTPGGSSEKHAVSTLKDGRKEGIITGEVYQIP
ncbi:hypothetical protein GALMADRAFT_247721 [Galerina marginata CBS 339.88]|uniref:DUF6534 domain-containing protein n=1 Tax=Galerina marginata (strain CBS 339.88) TaxID=685588 RepID=A0A067T1X9_GALM3|nr:hypothetical protein GALMADRAFT_247721 [Galerina marginata CBS 339.88]